MAIVICVKLQKIYLKLLNFMKLIMFLPIYDFKSINRIFGTKDLNFHEASQIFFSFLRRGLLNIVGLYQLHKNIFHLYKWLRSKY